MKPMAYRTMAPAIGLLLGLVGMAEADILGSWQYSYCSDVGGAATGIVFTFGRWDPIGGSAVASPVFEDMVISSSDVGRTFVASGADDPDFDGLAAILTNGVDDELAFMHAVLPCACGSGVFMLESTMFAGGDPDFIGHTIQSISLTIDSLEFDLHESQTDYCFDITVAIVPEPGMLSALVIGACLSPLLRFRIGRGGRGRGVVM